MGLLLFGLGSLWLALYPPLTPDLGGVEDLDRHGTHVRIAVAQNDSIDGWWLPGRQHAVILLLHGHGTDHRRMWRYGEPLWRAGYAVVMADFRSARELDRKPTTLGRYELEDARAILDWVREQPRWKAAPVGVFGEALGGTVALRLAAERPEVRAVMTDAAFAHSLAAIEDWAAGALHLPGWLAAPPARAAAWLVTGVDPGAIDVVPAARTLANRPLYLVHELDDVIVSPEQTRELWHAAGAHDPLWMVPRAGHAAAWTQQRALYEERMRWFFDAALLGAGPGLGSGELPATGVAMSAVAANPVPASRSSSARSMRDGEIRISVDEVLRDSARDPVHGPLGTGHR